MIFSHRKKLSKISHVLNEIFSPGRYRLIRIRETVFYPFLGGKVLSLDLLFLKLPFAIRPGLTDSRVANLIVLSNCTTKMKVEMITVQGSSVKQWVQAQYTGLVSWVIIST